MNALIAFVLLAPVAWIIGVVLDSPGAGAFALAVWWPIVWALLAVSRGALDRLIALISTRLPRA